MTSTFDKIRGFAQLSADKAKLAILPKIGSLIGKGVDIGHGLLLPSYKYEDKVNETLNNLYNSANESRKRLTPPKEGLYNYDKSNVDFVRRIGLGNVILRPPRPKQILPKKSPPSNPNAAFGLGNQGPNQVANAYPGGEIYDFGEPIFRNTGKRLPLSLMLPAKSNSMGSLGPMIREQSAPTQVPNRKRTTRKTQSQVQPANYPIKIEQQSNKLSGFKKQRRKDTSYKLVI